MRAKIILLFIFSVPAFAFETTYQRYITSHELFRTLTQVFPRGVRSVPEKCKQHDDSNRGVIGDYLAETGKVVSPVVPPSFVRWYLECLTAYVREELERNETFSFDEYLNSNRAFFPSSLIEHLNTLAFENADENFSWETVTWNSLPVAVADEIIQNRIEYMLGIGVLDSAQMQAMAARIKAAAIVDGVTLLDALKKITFTVAMSSEFLMY